MIGAASVLSVNAKMPFYWLIYVHGLIYAQEL